MKKKPLSEFVWDNKHRLDRMLDDIIDVQPEMIVLSNRVRAHRIMVDICAMYVRIKELEEENNKLQTDIRLRPLVEVCKNKEDRFYFYTYGLVELLKPEDPNKLSDIIERIHYIIEDVMYDYAIDHNMEPPEPFL